MAEVTGPISTLPGTGHRMPPEAMCDFHPDVPAVARIQGETDSFGAELHDVCETCLAAFRKGIAEQRNELRTCDWCKAEGVKVRPHRDHEEGMYGPVYQVCSACIAKENEALEAELARYAPLDDYYD
ncbi:MAG: hypothetical protein RLW87_06955 [Alphaproteobacteria bacterium]